MRSTFGAYIPTKSYDFVKSDDGERYDLDIEYDDATDSISYNLDEKNRSIKVFVGCSFEKTGHIAACTRYCSLKLEIPEDAAIDTFTAEYDDDKKIMRLSFKAKVVSDEKHDSGPAEIDIYKQRLENAVKDYNELHERYNELERKLNRIMEAVN
ncbi:MAG: hypothetical protein J6Y37_06715 [Paludibacteraceae bacterium]|nr:hypothetical protein [Paludibacteraceae bacterium]